MTKKLLIGLLVFLTVFAFVACKNEPEVKDVPDDKVEEFSLDVMETGFFGYFAYLVGEDGDIAEIEAALAASTIEYESATLDGTTLTITGVEGDNFVFDVTISDIALEGDEDDQLSYAFKLDSEKNKVTYTIDLLLDLANPGDYLDLEINISSLTIDGVAYKPNKVTAYINEHWDDPVA